MQQTDGEIMLNYMNLSKAMGRQVWLVPLQDYHNDALICAAAAAFMYGNDAFELDENPILIPVRKFNSIGVLDAKTSNMMIKNITAFKKEMRIK
jgi:hypothetical protein